MWWQAMVFIPLVIMSHLLLWSNSTFQAWQSSDRLQLIVSVFTCFWIRLISTFIELCLVCTHSWVMLCNRCTTASWFPVESWCDEAHCMGSGHIYWSSCLWGFCVMHQIRSFTAISLMRCKYFGMLLLLLLIDFWYVQNRGHEDMYPGITTLTWRNIHSFCSQQDLWAYIQSQYSLHKLQHRCIHATWYWSCISSRPEEVGM